jgi:predicted PurR-regulated permease PerM
MPNQNNTLSITTGSMIRFLLVLLGFFLVWVLRDLVLVVLTSIVVASFMESTVPFLKKIKLGRVFGMAVVYVILILLFAAFFYLFAPLLITEIYNLSVFLSTYAVGVDFLNYFNNEAFGGAKELVSSLGKDFSLEYLLQTSEAFLQNLSGGFFTTLSFAFGGLFNFALIVIVSFYLSIQERGIENFLRIILPTKYEGYVVDLWNRSSRKIALWMKGQIFVAFMVALLIYLVLALMGIEYALLLAIIAGITQIVPYGIWLALVPALSFSYLAGGTGVALTVFAVYMIIHQFESFLFTPLLINKVVGLSPLVVILSLLIGYELAGFWGIILAIPVAVVLMEYMSDLEKQKINIKNN